jgi:tetratricopeptide (TPR) repeat protein
MRSRLWLLLSILAFTAAASAPPTASAATRARVDARAAAANDRGYAFAEKKDYVRALEAYDEAVAAAPRDALSWANHGSVQFRLNNYDGCIDDITRAMALGLKSPVVVLNRGTCYFKKGDYRRALEDCNAIIRINPRNSVAHRTCGVAYEKSGDRERAFASFDTALKINPRDAKAFNDRGSAYQRAGEYRKALADFDAALSLDPDLGKNTDFVAARQAANDGLSDPGQPATAKAEVAPPTGTAKPVTLATEATKPAVPTPPVPAAAALSGPGAETRVALVIGNGSYASVGKLDNPAVDAAAVADALRRAGFKTVHVDTDLTAEAMRRALNDFSAEAAGADWALIYYAGHGIEAGGMNYLIPVDAQLKTDRAVQFETVPLDAALASVEGAKKLKIVILDACRDNPFLSKMTRTVATRSVGRGLGRVEPDTGSTLIAFAAKAGQLALDGKAGQTNSPFAAALVHNMDRPGVEIRKFFGLVRDEVMAQTGQAQEPFVYGSLGGNDYFFRKP